MKKLFCLILTLIMVLTVSGTGFAASEDSTTEDAAAADDAATTGDTATAGDTTATDDAAAAGDTATAGDTAIGDSEVPGAVRNVDSATYDPEMTEIETADTEASPGIVEINEQDLPEASALPDTGGIPAEAFYVAGALFVVAALIFASKKNKAGQKD